MDKIIPSFSSSLFDGSKDSIGDIVEIGIDSLLDDGLFKDIPLVNMLVGVKNTYQNLHDRNLLKQTLAFIKQFNSGTIDQNKLIKYKELINSDSKKAEKEFKIYREREMKELQSDFDLMMKSLQNKNEIIFRRIRRV